MTATQIGTVEILRFRVYALDAAMNHDQFATTVGVQPGVFPLYRDGISTYWVMEGNINTGGMHRLGDGIFSMTPGDVPDGPEVKFPSKTFGPDEWDEMVQDPACIEGSPAQRLRIAYSVQP